MILDCQFMYALPLDVMTPCKHRGISSYLFPVAGGCCGGFGGFKSVNFPATHGTPAPEFAGFISLMFFSNFNQHAFEFGLYTHTSIPTGSVEISTRVATLTGIFGFMIIAVEDDGSPILRVLVRFARP